MIPRITAKDLVRAFAGKRNGLLLFYFAAKQQQGGVHIRESRQIPRIGAFNQRVGNVFVIQYNIFMIRAQIIGDHSDIVAVFIRLKQAFFEISVIVRVIYGICVKCFAFTLVIVARNAADDGGIQPAA